jgi:hypothetical protein
MQLEIRQINTTVRPVETAEATRTHVNVAELARLVAAELESACAAAAGRSLLSDDPAGELGVER